MEWDAFTGTFINDAGQSITREAIKEMLERSILFTETQAMEFALSGTTERMIFNNMKEVIKREFIREYTVGIGGIDRMTQRDWGSIGGMLRNQYRYIREFSADLVAGNISEAQAKARISMFSNSAREAFSRSKARVALKNYREVEWELGATDASCEQCLERAQMGAVEVGPRGGFMVGDEEFFPGDGNSDCLTNCKCSLVYQNPEQETEEEEEYEL